jgi:hypothetical protein
MRLASFTAIATVLQEAGVRYLIAGGMAVNAHGYARFTKAVDVVVQLAPANILKAFTALAALDYRPAIAVRAEQFAEAQTRANWIRDEGMQVLQLWSDAHPETPIDVFVNEPFDFDAEYARALVKELYGTVAVRFVSLPTLIEMKRAVGRPQDLIDVENLNERVRDLG